MKIKFHKYPNQIPEPHRSIIGYGNIVFKNEPSVMLGTYNGYWFNTVLKTYVFNPNSKQHNEFSTNPDMKYERTFNGMILKDYHWFYWTYEVEFQSV